MGEWTFSCWSCAARVPMHDKPRRQDSCPKCTADMHACKNCRFYSTHAHNQCLEPVAEYTPDKERSNFCGMFEAHTGDRPQADPTTDARAKLEALFRKS